MVLRKKKKGGQAGGISAFICVSVSSLFVFVLDVSLVVWAVGFVLWLLIFFLMNFHHFLTGSFEGRDRERGGGGKRRIVVVLAVTNPDGWPSLQWSGGGGTRRR